MGDLAPALPQPPPGCAPFRYPGDPWQFAAWHGFIMWAIGKPEMREAFAEATGRRFMPPPASGLEAMIDAACGGPEREAETLTAFIEWLNVSHWGEDLVGWQPLPAVETVDV